ncbi:MAG: SDR family oxidoreductase [Gemmatimonadaceae bacterium]|nr:SDR family oxidoreductase [Gemmatimonadaceae bacterium]
MSDCRRGDAFPCQLRLLWVRALFLGFLLAQPIKPLPAQAVAASSRPTRAVLVTGASSGIGRRIAETLAREGFFVYAGARRAEDIAELSAKPNMQGIRLDVTQVADIAAAVRTVEAAGRGLYGVVNNAGVAAIAPLIEMDERELTSLFDVNVFGPYRITKAFSPLLIASRGRVVNISSISGILSGPLLGAYSMSKHAVEAYGDALSAEVARFGVRVSLIEPGNYRSEIGRTTIRQIEGQISRQPNSPYQAQMRNMVTAMAGYDNYPEPDAVAAAALHALNDSLPRARYMVVPEARQAEVTIKKAIDELVQLNHGHPFTYDRATLIKLLDESLAKMTPPGR